MREKKRRTKKMSDLMSGMLVTREEYQMACREYDKKIAALEDENAELREKLINWQQETECIVIPCKPYCIGCNMIDLERKDLPFPDNEINHRCKHAAFCNYQWNRWEGELYDPDEPEEKSVVISEP